MSEGKACARDKSETNSRNSKDKKCASPSDSETTFNTLPYYYKIYKKFDDTTIHVTKHATIPHVEPNSEKYSPIPYIFRISDNSNNKCLSAMVRCPPFHVQLDHAIAVVWSLYSAEETDIPLGLNQLQWAFSFLQNVKDRDSSYPRDVEHCMESITDEIIEQYADMAECLSTPQSSMSSFNPQANSTKQDVRDEEDKDKECPCGAESSVRFADEDDVCSASSGNSSACNKLPEYPFSVTYNDMRLHNRSLDDEARKKKENICNNDKVSSFLNDMRKDQLQKILGELDRLHNIEKYITNTDEDFDPYLDESDQELKDFIEKKLEGCRSDGCEGKEKQQDREKEKRRCEDGQKGQKEQKKEKKSGSKSSVICTDEKKETKDEETQDQVEKKSKRNAEEDEEDDKDDESVERVK